MKMDQFIFLIAYEMCMIISDPSLLTQLILDY